MVNWTIPGRLHLIVRWRRLLYFTLWFRGRRYHYCRPTLPEWNYEWGGNHDPKKGSLTHV